MQTALNLVLRALFHLVSPRCFDVDVNPARDSVRNRVPGSGSAPRLTVVLLRSGPGQGNDKQPGPLQLQELATPLPRIRAFSV